MFTSLILCFELNSDDRPEYASVQAILYGPYLLVGHTTGDWDLKAGANSTFADWITPIPANYNSQLFTLYQGFANSTYALTNTNQSLTMESLPVPTPDPDLALDKTFRLVPKDPSTKFSTWKDLIGKSVSLELLNPPGMIVIHQGPNKPLVVVDHSNSGASSSFIVVHGLDGQNKTISIKPETNGGCFVTTDGGVKLSCSGSGAAFSQAASFIVQEGVRKYNPISFVAKGANRDFLLEPLFTFKDLPYTVYFNFQN